MALIKSAQVHDSVIVVNIDILSQMTVQKMADLSAFNIVAAPPLVWLLSQPSCAVASSGLGSYIL